MKKPQCNALLYMTRYPATPPIQCKNQATRFYTGDYGYRCLCTKHKYAAWLEIVPGHWAIVVIESAHFRKIPLKEYLVAQVMNT